MFQSEVGRIFLNAYNKKYETNYTPKEFFMEIWYPMFFESDTHMMSVMNSVFCTDSNMVTILSLLKKNRIIHTNYENISPNTITIPEKIKFENIEMMNLKIEELKVDKDVIAIKNDSNKKKIQYVVYYRKTPERAKLLLEQFFSKIEDICNLKEIANGSVVIGYGVKEKTKPTSCFDSDINVRIDEDMILLSWVGQSLGVGVEGGYTLLFKDSEILLAVYEGWSEYRNLLKESTKEIPIPVNKINTWNGQWLRYRLSEYYNPQKNSFNTFENEQLLVITKDKKTKVITEIEIPTIEWMLLFMAITIFKHNQDSIMSYVYQMGQSNKTLGFFPIKIHKIRHLIDLYRQIFNFKSAEVFQLYKQIKMENTIENMCLSGAIGYDKHYEPKEKGVTKKIQKSFLKTKEVWRIIMSKLSVEQRKFVEEKLIPALLNYSESGTNNQPKQRVKNLLDIKNKSFSKHINILKDIMEDTTDKSVKEIYNTWYNIVDENENNFNNIFDHLTFKYAYIK